MRPRVASAEVSSGDDEPWDPIGPSGPRVKRPKHVPYFLRPKQPHDWRWVLGGVGKAMISLGLLMFAFAGYQLWGTGIQTARAQDGLGNDFRRLMSATTVAPVETTTTTTIVTTDTEPTSSVSTTSTTTTVPTAPAGPPIADGDVVARLRIPKIDLDWYVVQGVAKDDLSKGPGHFGETPMPGQLGNSAIAGHRTTYGAPFGDLDELQPGDLIQVTTIAGDFTYSVTGTTIVEPTEYESVIPTIDPTVATLTLTTCHPEYSSSKRMVVKASLVLEQSDQVMAPPSNTLAPDPGATLPDEGAGTTAEAAGSLPDTTLPDTTLPDTTLPDTTLPDTTPPDTTVVASPASSTRPSGDAFTGGWFDDSAAIPHAIVWGLVLAAVVAGAYFLGRKAKRVYVCFLVGFVPAVIVMYFFFENVNRLLPPGL